MLLGLSATFTRPCPFARHQNRSSCYTFPRRIVPCATLLATQRQKSKDENRCHLPWCGFLWTFHRPYLPTTHPPTLIQITYHSTPLFSTKTICLLVRSVLLISASSRQPAGENGSAFFRRVCRSVGTPQQWSPHLTVIAIMVCDDGGVLPMVFANCSAS